MTIDEFLEDMARLQSSLQAYQKNRGQFAEDCVTEVFSCIKTHYAYTGELESSAMNNLVATFQAISMQVYDTLEQFMRHYNKTENFTFQIVPEKDWNKEIEMEGILADFTQFFNAQETDSVSFEADVAKFKTMRKHSKDAYFSVHKVLKQKAFEYYPAILDLPGLGLRELDFILFQEAKNYMEVFDTIILTKPRQS